MARGDGQYAKHFVDWHRDPRCRKLKSANYKWLNFVLWNLCVKERRSTLPSWYDTATIAQESGIDVRTVRKGLEKMSQKCIGLITINSDQSITVHGVREVHSKMKWKDSVQKRSLNDSESKSESKSDSDTVHKPEPPPDAHFEKLNSQTSDLPRSSTYRPEDVHEVVNHSMQNYKPGDNRAEIMAQTHHLFGSGVTKTQLIKAIDEQKKLSISEGNAQRFWKRFKDAFPDSGAVAWLASGKWRNGFVSDVDAARDQQALDEAFGGHDAA